MLPYFWYLLKVIICSGILFGYYWLFLRNKIFHQYNRFYLLAAMGLSLLLPLLKINFWQQGAESNQAIRVLQAVSVGDEYMNNIVITANSSSWNFQNMYPLLYWLVSLVFLFVLVRTLFIIGALLKKYPVQRIEDVSFVNTSDDSTPFSFFKYIFWNSSIDMSTVTGKQIFKHEVAHIQEKHTYDKLFVNITLIFCWCNPFFWLYRKELNMIHEFIADKKAVEDSDTAAFAAMILQTAYPKQRFELTNNFFYSPIKRRLLMLTKIDNPRVSYFVRVMALPLAVFVFAAFTFKAKTNASIYHGKKITVVIDAGHGGKDLGAKSIDGIYEKDFTLAIAKKIEELNSNGDIEIVLTRDEDIFMSAFEKVDFAKRKNADLVISFHVDSGPKESANKHTGISFWVAREEFPNTEKSKILASAIINEFSNNYGLDVMGGVNQRKNGIWILQGVDCPSVLIETGFINNDKDVAYLKTPAAKETIAKNVLAAIEKFANSQLEQNNIRNNTSINDTLPTSIFINAKHSDTNYSKSNDFKNKALVIVDSKEIGNVGINYIDQSNEKFSTVVIYNQVEAQKIYGAKGKYGVIKLTKNDVVSITADTVFFDEKTRSIKLSGSDINLKGDYSDALIYLENKIITADQLKTVDPKKIDHIRILQGDKLNDVTDAKGKKSVIYISLKANDLPGVTVSSKLTRHSQASITLNKMNVFYIGINNPITVNGGENINPEDVMVHISDGTITGNNGKHIVRVTHIGDVTLTLSKKDGTKIPGIFSFTVERLPDPVDGKLPIDLDVKVTPRIYIGDIANVRADVELFKKQKEIRTTRGYVFNDAMVYFSGASFKEVVMVQLNGSSLKPVEGFIERCTAGSVMTFDNVRVKDADGKLITIGGMSIALYESGEITDQKKAMQLQKEKFSLQQEQQAIAKSDYDKNRAAIKEQDIAKEKELVALKEQQHNDDNKIFTKTEVAPQFTGGDEAWRKYLQKNLNANTPVDEGWKAGKYTVIIKFIVRTDGTVSDVKAETFAGTKTAQHCIDIIKNAPTWMPAVQNGRKVNAYKRQPITFLVEEAAEKIKSEASNIFSVPLKVHLMNDGKVNTYNMVGNGTFTVKSGRLYFLNGKIISNPQNIPSTSVIAMESYDEASGQKYFGDKGKYGVLLLKTKS